MKKSDNIKCPWCGEVFVNNNSFCPYCNCKVNGTEKSRINNKLIVDKEKRGVVKSCKTTQMYKYFNDILDWKGFRFLWRKKWHLVIITILLIVVIGLFIFVMRHPFLTLFILFVVLGVLDCIVNGGSGGMSSASGGRTHTRSVPRSGGSGGISSDSGGGGRNICDRDGILER